MTTRVLFLCTGNSARSILAEALLKEMGGESFEVYSAGTDPKGISPYTLKVLDQEHIDASQFHSKSMNEFTAERFDYVITVCDQAAERCPVFPGDPARIHWSFPDPAAVEGDETVRLAAFQETLRGLRRRLEPFVIVARDAAHEGARST
jgi:arsenate reductase (thioredoxin)